MGQEIFYCGSCKILLRSRDLEKGQAVKSGDQVYCKACAEAQGLRPPPPSTPRSNKTSQIQVIPTPRTPRTGVHPVHPAAPSKLPFLLAGAAGVLVVLLLFVGGRGGAPKPREPERLFRPDPEVVVEPAPPDKTERLIHPRPEKVEPRPAPPKPVDREAGARRLLEDAKAASLAGRLDEAASKARAALLEAEGTALEAQARGLDETIRNQIKLSRARAWAEIEARLKAEDFEAALGLLDADKSAEASARAADARRQLDLLWADVKAKLHAARRKGAAAEVDALRSRVERWGVPRIVQELNAALGEPVEAELPAELVAWRKRLAELVFPLDYAATAKDLEKATGADAADLDVLRLAAEVQRELAQLKFRPGAEFQGGRVVRSTAHALEIQIGDERAFVALCELPPATLCELVKAKPAAAAAYRALEGDGGELPPNLKAVVERLLLARETPAELEARKLLTEAERDFARPGTRLSAAAKYAAIPKDTILARRAKGLIEERIAACSDVFIRADELLTEGACVATETLKGAPTLSFLGHGAARVAAEAPRAWVYAGACCQETFALHVHAPDPVPLKAPSLRAKHAHAGRELKWMWIALPPNLREIRLSSDREGTSIAYLWLSAGRPGPPREAELQAYEKSMDVEFPPAPRGSLLREVWTELPGHTLCAFGGRPASAGAIPAFEGPAGIGDNYLTRVRGYLHPPSSGDYVFFLASDDCSELWISADETPARTRRVAAVHAAAPPRGWDDANAARSGPVPLKAGKRYYVELLHKEGVIEDHFAVGWRLPDGGMERPIPGTRLSPYVGSRRPPATALYRAIDLNGPGGFIDGQNWEGKDAPNVAHNGNALEFTSPPLAPPVDAVKARMIQTFLWNRDGFTLTVSNVPPGRYLVYAYVCEDNGNQVFDVLLNNRVVKEKQNSGEAGRWERAGPWTVDTADGKIELRATAADANFSGLEIWRTR